ncbi:MAG: N-acetyltransferase [Acetobacteraceae bacterium]|nr:N-acetyltransferase [Acetobacteraceae bacterium]
MNPAWHIRTARLDLWPVGWGDLADLVAIKSDPGVFAMMLGGVRGSVRVAEELALDIVDWGVLGYGVWAVRDIDARVFRGLVALQARPDGRGVALRFAFWRDAQGRGLAREAAGAALRFGHDQAGLGRIVAVARYENTASRIVLGGVGMTEVERFTQTGHAMLLYESVRLSLTRATSL